MYLIMYFTFCVFMWQLYTCSNVLTIEMKFAYLNRLHVCLPNRSLSIKHKLRINSTSHEFNLILIMKNTENILIYAKFICHLLSIIYAICFTRSSNLCVCKNSLFHLHSIKQHESDITHFLSNNTHLLIHCVDAKQLS